MKTFATVTAACLALLAAAAPAAAQAPGQGPAAYDPTPVAPPPPPRIETWSVGAHVASLSLAPKGDKSGDAQTDMGGGGVHVRYRMTPRWGFELSLDDVKGDIAQGMTRESGSATLSVAFHMRPGRRWDWYLLAGVGGGTEKVTRDGKMGDTIEETFQQSQVQLGAGLERRFGSFGVSAELRLVGAKVDPDKGDAPSYTDMTAPIPFESNGGSFRLAGTYYF